MFAHQRFALLLLSFLLLLPFRAFTQSSFPLKEGLNATTCKACQDTLDAAPHEVLYGIHINLDGEVSFTTNSVQWFHKIFRDPRVGITADLVSRSRYRCGETPDQKGITRGFVLTPLYRDSLIRLADTISGQIQVVIGKVPAALKEDILEGSLVFVRGDSICRYVSPVQIDQKVLDLLPMGLYTDTLLQQDYASEADDAPVILYSTQQTITIPFGKGNASFAAKDLQALRDSITRGHYSIRHVELRAYTSVDGPAEANRRLMQQRAGAVRKALAVMAPGGYTTTVIPAENWIEFNRDVLPLMPHFARLSKRSVKQALQNQTVLNNLEPLLARHRKVVITLWLDKSTKLANLPAAALLPAFNKQVKARNIPDSRRILKEIAVRISQNKLPDDYINKLEVPRAIDYEELLSDKAIYRYSLGQIYETEALNALYVLKRNCPNDPFMAYNISVLKLISLQHETGNANRYPSLNEDIRKLSQQGIHPSLVSRLLLNYYILRSEQYMRAENFTAKDRAVEYISHAYKTLPMNDQSRYSLAQFFTAYGRSDLAMEIIRPRVNKLDANSNIVFYFLNLCFFQPDLYESEDFSNAVLNAANLDRKRFCQFFYPPDLGGASMQLLESDVLRKYNCDNCGK